MNLGKIVKHGLRVHKIFNLVCKSIPLIIGVWIGSKTTKKFGRTSQKDHIPYTPEFQQAMDNELTKPME